MKKNILLFSAISIISLAMTACSTDKAPTDSTDSGILQTEHTNYDSESSSAEEPTSKAELTEIEKRDALEWEQLLDYNSDRQKELSLIHTNLSENPADISVLGNKVIDSLKEHDIDNAVAMVADDLWSSTMLPKLVIGQRNYYCEDDNGSSTIIIATDEIGSHYSKIMTIDNDNKIVLLELTDDMIHTLICDYNSDTDVYSGAFVSEYLNLKDGNYVKNDGTLSDGGIVNGELTISKAILDLSYGYTEAWAARDNQLNVYTSEFDNNGYPTLETPAEIASSGNKAYAVRDTEQGKEYLTVNSDRPIEHFTGEMLGVCTFVNQNGSK